MRPLPPPRTIDANEDLTDVLRHVAEETGATPQEVFNAGLRLLEEAGRKHKAMKGPR